MKRRSLGLAASLALFAVAAALRPEPKEIHRSEQWLEGSVPLQVENYRSIPGPNGSTQTYTMDAETYKLLQPYGIVSRVYDNGKSKFDVAVIASNTRNSFHDPQHCFPGQDWQVLSSSVVGLGNVEHGVIPLTLMLVQHGGPPLLAGYCFRGPRGFVATQNDLYLQWAVTNFITGEPQEGCSFRFICLDPTIDKGAFLNFARDLIGGALPSILHS